MRFRHARRFLLLSAGFLSLSFAQAGCDQNRKASPTQELWLHQLGTAQADSLYAVTANATAVYAAGSTSGQLPGYAGGTQGSDGLLFKLNLSGQMIWQRQYGTLGEDEWRSVAVDAAGNAYAVGFTSGVFAGQTRSGGDTDAVIARILPDGTLDWVRQFGTTSADYLMSVVLDSAGNVYAAGWTAGAFAGQTLNGASDGFVVKYSASGTQQWLMQFGCPKEDSINAMAIDKTGALYLGGWATDAVAAGQTPLGKRDAALYKILPSSGIVWARQFGSTDDDEAAAIGTDADNVYVSGRTTGSLPTQTQSGGQDALAASYDFAGNSRWLRQFGTMHEDAMQALSINASGIYVGGYVSLPLTPNQTWNGKQDAVYTKLTSTGSQDWVSQFGTANDDVVLGLFSDASDALYAVGYTEGALPEQTALGARDSFIARYILP